MSYFPLKIRYSDNNDVTVVVSPNDIVSDRPFTVLETNYKKYRFYQDEIVTFRLAHHCGIGKILGVSTSEMPVIGHMWIIQIVHCPTIPTNDYPFNTIIVPENSVFKADKQNTQEVNNE